MFAHLHIWLSKPINDIGPNHIVLESKIKCKINNVKGPILSHKFVINVYTIAKQWGWDPVQINTFYELSTVLSP